MTPNLDKIIEHYNHAREKHPYFCDKITKYNKDNIYHIGANIKNCKWQIETYPNNRNIELDVTPLLSCRWLELVQAYVNGNYPIAIEMAYKSIAVFLRVIDVLEGQQALGKPEEVKE